MSPRRVEVTPRPAWCPDLQPLSRGQCPGPWGTLGTVRATGRHGGQPHPSQSSCSCLLLLEDGDPRGLELTAADVSVCRKRGAEKRKDCWGDGGLRGPGPSLRAERLGPGRQRPGCSRTSSCPGRSQSSCGGLRSSRFPRGRGSGRTRPAVWKLVGLHLFTEGHGRLQPPGRGSGPFLKGPLLKATWPFPYLGAWRPHSAPPVAPSGRAGPLGPGPLGLVASRPHPARDDSGFCLWKGLSPSCSPEAASAARLVHGDLQAEGVWLAPCVATRPLPPYMVHRCLSVTWTGGRVLGSEQCFTHRAFYSF